MLRSFRLVFLVLSVLMGLSASTGAHEASLSGIRIVFRQKGAVVSVTTHVTQLARAERRTPATISSDELDRAVRRRLHLQLDGQKPQFTKGHVIRDDGNDILSWQAVVAGAKADGEVTAGLYPENPAFQTAVTVIRDGQVVREDLLGGAPSPAEQDAAPVKPLMVVVRYVREGITHIFGGPDHVAFVLGLLLFGGTLKKLLRTTTAFTLAHSVTLTLAATGVWTPLPRIVEPLIALSIVVIAVENLRHWRGRQSDAEVIAPSDNRRDRRPYYAFGFGLIHGFGFARALAEVGLPRTALGVALASFNVGVEIGQVAILLAAVPIVAWLAKHHPVAHRNIIQSGAVAIGIAGVYWLVTRLQAL